MKSPEWLRRLALIQTSGKDHRLKLVKKNHSE